MVSITTKTGSFNGVIFEELPASEFLKMEPRVTKARTLDGGTSIDHRGFVEGDREFDIKASLDSEQSAALKLIFENETIINLACKHGFFEGVISRLLLDNGKMEMFFWVYVAPATIPSSGKSFSKFDNLRISESVTVSI